MFSCREPPRNVTGERSGWKRQPPSSMRTWMPSMPRSSSCSTLRCAASPSPSVAGLCLPLLTKPRPSGSAAACRDGRRASSVRNSLLSAAISRTTNGWAMPPSRWSTISRPSSSGFPSTRPLPTSRAAPISSVRLPKLRGQSAAACGRSLAFRSRSAWRAPSIWRKLPRKWPSPTGWWLSIPTPNWNSFTTCPSS